MFKSAHIVTAAAATALTASAFTADAQDSFFERNRYTAVADRAQPEYDPVPVRLGAAEARARLRTGVGYRTNLFASTTNETSDAFAVIAPSVDVNTTWSRHEIGVSAFAEHTEYQDTSSESATDYGARAFGRLDATGDLSLVGAVRGDHTNEPRSAAASDPSALEPVEVDRIGGEAGADYENGRIRLRGRLSADSYDYQDSPLAGGAVLDQDFRDRDELGGSLRVSYAPQRDWAVFAEGIVTDRSYDNPATPALQSRDSQGRTLRVGTNFELPILVRGDIAVGYHQFEYDDPTIDEVNGLSVQGNANWFVTQLTTISASATRGVIDPGLQGSASATQTALGVTVDHELRRNWLIDAGVDVSNYDFEDINREDDRYDLHVGTLWKVNRNVALRLAYRYTDQDSNQRSFTDNRVTASLTLTP